MVDNRPRITRQGRPGTFFSPEATADIASAMNAILADVFALFVKTKNFHWHVSGPHFRDHHRLFEEQALQLLSAVDGMAERVRKIGGTTLRSVGHIARLTQIRDNDEAAVVAPLMLAELLLDNAALAERMRQAHCLCGEHGDIASVGLLEVWIDEAEQRAWFLSEIGQSVPSRSSTSAQ